MKTTAIENTAETNYPCLKQHKDGTIVLFKTQDTGVTVHSTDPSDIGRMRRGGGNEEWFKLYNGTVTLEN